jgi:ABC-type transporter Mla maintaining outer membrane lipid asymmetry permease subunit MlaE
VTVEVSQHSDSYAIKGRVTLSDLETLQIPRDATIDLAQVSDIDQLSIIFLRSTRWKVRPPTQSQVLHTWNTINHQLNAQLKFLRPQQISTRPLQSGVAGVFQFVRNLYNAIGRPTRLAKEIAWIQLYNIGWSTLPSILCISICCGIAVPIQVLGQLPSSVESEMPRIFAFIVVEYAAPLIGASILSARCVSTITADIGSAQINEEWDALIMAGHNPYHCWCWPRICVCIMMTLLLIVLFAFTSAMVGATLLAYRMLNSSVIEILGMMQVVLSQDLGCMLLLVKSILFGCTISCVALYYGCTTNPALGLGSSINAAVRTAANGLILAHLLVSSYASLYLI